MLRHVSIHTENEMFEHTLRWCIEHGDEKSSSSRFSMFPFKPSVIGGFPLPCLTSGGSKLRRQPIMVWHLSLNSPTTRLVRSHKASTMGADGLSRWSNEATSNWRQKPNTKASKWWNMMKWLLAMAIDPFQYMYIYIYTYDVLWYVISGRGIIERGASRTFGTPKSRNSLCLQAWTIVQE